MSANSLQLESLKLSGESTPLAAFDCEPGTITVLLGTNRSGKTALCRWLAGLPANAEGTLSLGSRVLSDLAPAKRPVALVNQAFVNYPHWTVADNLASPLRAQRVRASERALRVEHIAQLLDLEPLLERRPEQLSGGQQQRLAIGRALAKGAPVLVMDEPFANLDFKLRESLERELRALVAAEQLIVIYASTDPREALALADQLVLLADHQLLQVGPPATLYQSPTTLAAARLLSEPDLNQLDASGWLRPEHLTLEPPPVQAVSVEVEVVSVETNGSHSYLYGTRLDEQEARSWVARLPGMPSLAVGQRVQLFARCSDRLQFSRAA